MLSVSGVSINLGARSLLSNVSFVVNRGTCVALIGRNGSGKSTLMRAIAGEFKPDEGAISLEHAAETLIAALRVLGQQPPDELNGGSSADIWRWAQKNWNIDVLKQITEIPVGHIPLAQAGKSLPINP